MIDKKFCEFFTKFTKIHAFLKKTKNQRIKKAKIFSKNSQI